MRSLEPSDLRRFFAAFTPLMFGLLGFGVASPYGVLAETSTLRTKPPISVCGDGAGSKGKDIRCSCGDTVITNTTLAKNDPVVKNKSCSGDGLSLAAGVVLDMDGQAIVGAGSGVGVAIANGGTVRHGTVQGFENGIAALGGAIVLRDLLVLANMGDGLVVGQSGGGAAPQVALTGAATAIADNGAHGIVVHPGASLTVDGGTGRVASARNLGIGVDVHGTLVAANIDIASNGSHGMLVETDTAVLLQAVSVHENGGNGIYVLRASGTPLESLSQPSASFKLEPVGLPRNQIHGNLGDGVVLGDQVAQSGIVNAAVSGTVIANNGAAAVFGASFGGAGLRIEEKDADTASTHWSIHSNDIYDNRGLGVHLRPSFPVPIGVDGLAFVDNSIHHNAQPANPSCLAQGGFENDGLALAPQVWVEGPLPYEDPVCSEHSGNQVACEDQNDPVQSVDGNVHGCVFANPTCRTAYNLSGVCGASANRFYNYTGTGRELPLTVGFYISGGAAVLADRNHWQFGGSPFLDWALGGGPEDFIRVPSLCTGFQPSCP